MAHKTPDDQARERAEEEDAQRSLVSLRHGGLPVRAERRLSEQARKGHALFTSDLSVDEFLTTRHAGCDPIGQVMGSSIYHVGWTPAYKGYTGEVESVSQAHREARRLALARLEMEARLLGAHGVIGVRLRAKGYEWSEGLIEFSAIGTAIRLPDNQPVPASPFLSGLSGQQFWTLLQSGFRPAGLAIGISIYHVHHVLYPGGWSFNQELGAATKGFYSARHLAMQRLEAEARALGANGVVATDLSTKAREIECTFPECEYKDLEVEFMAMGTAIIRMSERPSRPAPQLTLSMLPLRGSRTAGRELRLGEGEQAEGALAASRDQRAATRSAEEE